ncbi:MAG: pseudouridine synthase, partial [Bacteroidia bacterium]
VSGKVKASVNPYDLDESDFEYGSSKPTFEGTKGKDFKKKPYEKKPYTKKTWSGKTTPASKPQREVDDGLTRLNKFISNAGICSRREADDLIASGVVQVNGKTITEMGYRVKPTDIIKYGGQTLKRERMVYLILNKPKDYITTADDPQQRRTVLELVQGACKERIYPVGRLDRATTGLLMFTNDGDLTKKLTHPKYGVRKIYHVELDKPLKRTDLDQIAAGIELEDGPIKVDEVTYVGDGTDKTQVGVEIHSGKNRIVRRIFEHMGYNVRKLDRVMFGSLTKKDLPRGRWRLLSEAEVGMLKMISTEA